jgi:Mn2+/Fe2+ NRAMP family transporter
VIRDTLVPSMLHTRDEWTILVAILGTTISPYLFFWQASEEVEEEKAAGLNSRSQRRGATAIELRLRKMDVGVGTFFSNIVIFFITLAGLLRPCFPAALSVSDSLLSRRWRDQRPMPSRKRWGGAKAWTRN